MFVENVECKSYNSMLFGLSCLLLGYFHSSPGILSPVNQMQLFTSLLLLHSSSSSVKACSTSVSFSCCNELS